MRLHRLVNSVSTRAGAAPQISDLRRSSLALGQTSFAKGKAALIAVLLALLCFILAGCGATPIQDEMSFEAPGEQISIRIIAGDTIIDAVLYENGTAQSFAKLLPLTVDLWMPIHYAQAFDLPQRIPDNDERTRAYERGAIGYWYEGPSIALLYGEDEAQTAVPIVKIGKMLSNLSALETYRGTVTVELAHQG